MDRYSRLQVLSVLLLIGRCVHGGMSIDGILENYDPNNPQNPFNDASITQNNEHMKEHLQEEINVDPSKMSPEQMEFHYFRLHDTNGDSKLDGLEILKALQHNVPKERADLIFSMGTEGKSEEEKQQMINKKVAQLTEYYSQTIDRLLEEDDKDLDGYLTYPEYASSRRRQQAKYEEAMQKIKHMDPQQIQNMQQQVAQLQQQLLSQQNPQVMQNLQMQVQQLNQQITQNPDILKKVQQMVQNPEQLKHLQQTLSGGSRSMEESAEQIQKIQKLLNIQN